MVAHRNGPPAFLLARGLPFFTCTVSATTAARHRRRCLLSGQRCSFDRRIQSGTRGFSAINSRPRARWNDFRGGLEGSPAFPQPGKVPGGNDTRELLGLTCEQKGSGDWLLVFVRFVRFKMFVAGVTLISFPARRRSESIPLQTLMPAKEKTETLLYSHKLLPYFPRLVVG